MSVWNEFRNHAYQHAIKLIFAPGALSWERDDGTYHNFRQSSMNKCQFSQIKLGVPVAVGGVRSCISSVNRPANVTGM